MDHAVHRQIFWLLKRHTSYTAWKRTFTAFERVLDHMDALRPKLREAAPGTYGLPGVHYSEAFQTWTDWPHIAWLKESKNSYARALRALREGDKRPLADYYYFPAADTFSGLATGVYAPYSMLVGYEPGERFFGPEPRVPNKSVLVAAAYQAARLWSENIGVVAPERSRTGFLPMYNAFSQRLAVSVLTGSAISEVCDPLDFYPLPAQLPPVPEVPPYNAECPERMKRLSTVQSGEYFPESGIYISRPGDDLYYGHKDTPAPFLRRGPGETEAACAWTLLWADTRYMGGKAVPEEERCYFPDQTDEQEAGPLTDDGVTA